MGVHVADVIFELEKLIPLDVAGLRCRELAELCECDPKDMALFNAWLDEIARLVAIVEAVEAEPEPGQLLH